MGHSSKIEVEMVIFYRVLVGLLFICVYSAHANASVEFHHAD